MKSFNKKAIVGHRQPLVKKLLLVEGISRAGKFLLANIVSGVRGVEPVQYHGLLEWIPVFESFGLMDKRMSQELLQCEIDTHCYEMLIGRNLNFRRGDKSSIFNVPRYGEYLRRCRELDGDEAVKKFKKMNAYSFFLTHELMPNITLYLDTFPGIKILSLLRSPADLVFSWYKRGLARRLGVDPKLGVIPFTDGREFYPWYMQGRASGYARLAEVDRVIVSILTLFKKNSAAYGRLPGKYKKRILFVTYEGILSDPHQVVQRLTRFLGHQALPEMKRILRREKLPNHGAGSEDSMDKKIQEIQALASPKYFKQLMAAQKDYQAKWL